LLAADGRDDDVAGAFARYHDHLASSRDLFPPSAYALATSGWYFSFSDHRCPHDSWLESLSLTELGSEARGETRKVSMRVRLVGAYRDGYIELTYPRVFRYRMSVDDGERGHGDWRYDELRLSADGHVVHEIEWRGRNQTGSWLIEPRMSSSGGYRFERCSLPMRSRRRACATSLRSEHAGVPIVVPRHIEAGVGRAPLC